MCAGKSGAGVYAGRMKITVWGINYDPEPTGIAPFNTDLCAWLAERGHEVTMLTGFPYYPRWKKRDEDRRGFWRREKHGAVDVRRCWLFVPARPSTWKRLAHELSFVFVSSVRALFSRAPDVYVVVSPPLFLGLGARVVSRLRRRPFVFHVQDLQPDAALGLGMIKPGPAVRALYAIERWAYGGASVVSGISEGMMAAFRRKGVPAEKMLLFPNWIPDGAGRAADSEGAQGRAVSRKSFREANGIAGDVALVAYSGNLGMKQGLDVVVDAAAGGNGIHWAICGDGAARGALAERIARAPGSGAKLYPIQDDDFYQALLREADVSLITQQRGTGQFFFPSKLLSILRHGRPVLAVADDDSELARAVREGRFGVVAPPGDAEALRAAALEMAGADDTRKREWAANGRAWVARFQRSRVLAEFEARLARVALQ